MFKKIVWNFLKIVFKYFFSMVWGQVMFHNSNSILILWFICRFHSNSAIKKKRGTDHGRTDGPTDGPTDRPSYRDAWTHLKTKYWTPYTRLLQKRRWCRQKKNKDRTHSRQIRRPFISTGTNKRTLKMFKTRNKNSFVRPFWNARMWKELQGDK